MCLTAGLSNSVATAASGPSWSCDASLLDPESSSELSLFRFCPGPVPVTLAKAGPRVMPVAGR